MKPVSPCKDCDRRAPRCHGKCAKYAEFRAKCDAEIAARVEYQKKNEMTESQMRALRYERYQAKKGHRSNVYK